MEEGPGGLDAREPRAEVARRERGEPARDGERFGVGAEGDERLAEGREHEHVPALGFAALADEAAIEVARGRAEVPREVVALRAEAVARGHVRRVELRRAPERERRRVAVAALAVRPALADEAAAELRVLRRRAERDEDEARAVGDRLARVALRRRVDRQRSGAAADDAVAALEARAAAFEAVVQPNVHAHKPTIDVRGQARVVARVAGAGDVAHDERVDDPQVRGVLDEAGEDLRDDRRDRRGEALGEPGRRARQVRQRAVRDGARRLPGLVPLRRPALARAFDLADDPRRVREDALGRPDVLFPVRAARQRVGRGRAATIDAGRRRVALRSLVALAPMLPAVPRDGLVQR